MDPILNFVTQLITDLFFDWLGVKLNIKLSRKIGLFFIVAMLLAGVAFIVAVLRAH